MAIHLEGDVESYVGKTLLWVVAMSDELRFRY